MKKLHGLFIGLSALLFVLQIGFVSTASAQNYNREYERQRLAAVLNPNANPEEFRAEMINYLTELENALQRFEKFPAVSHQFDKDGLDPVATLQNARVNLADLPTEDLVRMRAVYARVQGWREAPRAIAAIVERLEQGRSSGKKSNDINPNVITPDACPDLSGTPSFADIAITEGFQIAADAVMEGFPTDFVSILARLAPVAIRAGLKAAVLAENTLRSQYDDCHGLSSTDVQGIVDGAKTDIINNDNSNASTIVNNDNTNKNSILSSLTSSTTSINNNVTSAKTDIINNDNSNKTMITTAITNAQTSINNTAGSNTTAITTAITNAQNTIVNNDNSNKTMIVNNDNSNAAVLNTNLTNARNTIITNDNTNTTNIVNNDNTNKTAIINNDNANTTTLINNGNANTMALNDLVLRSQIEADLATESNSVKVAWYMTPTANGGKLDLVQQIVTLTLANIQAAGGSIGNAQSFLTQANADKAAGNFKSAYDNYRKAYKAAAN